MKAILFVLVLTLAVDAQADDKPRSFVTADGRHFDNVTVTDSDPSSVSVMTDSGVEHVAIETLPPSMQKEFGYDPAKAAAFAKVQAEQRKAQLRQAQALAEEQAATMKLAAEKMAQSQKIVAERTAQLEKAQEAARYAAAGQLNPDDYPAELRWKIEDYNKSDDGPEDQRNKKSDLDDYVDYIKRQTDKALVEKTKAAVAARTYFFGMSWDAFKVVMGASDKINMDEGANHFSAQCIYGDSNYYFDDGVLTYIQK